MDKNWPSSLLAVINQFVLSAYTQRRRLMLCATAVGLALGLYGLLFLAWPLTPEARVQADSTVFDSPLLQDAAVLATISPTPSTSPTPTVTATRPVSTALYFPAIRARIPGVNYLPIIGVPNPLLPDEPYPPDGATGQSPNTFLTWSTYASSTHVVHYDILLDANNPDPTTVIARGLTKRSFDPYTFDVDTQYYWRVIADDLHGNRIAGPVWTFRIEPPFDPANLGTMLRIPAGEFLMGCDPAVEDCFEENARPLHRVYLDTYEIDKYEITNLEYRQCVEAGVCPRPRRYDSAERDKYFLEEEYNYYPVMYVSWWNAQTYCGWVGKRIPTEAEWEKAARGPIDTREWPWGNEGPTCERANYYVKCSGDSQQVGSHPSGASPYGVMDMTGNMFEWVKDRYVYHYYEFSPYANPQGPQFSQPNPKKRRTSHPYFVIRGGSYHDNWWYSRITHRHWGHHGDKPGQDAPEYRSFRVGIRCARSVNE